MTTQLVKAIKREVIIDEKRYHVALDWRGVFIREVGGPTRSWRAVNWSGLLRIMQDTDEKPQAAPVEQADLPDEGEMIEAQDGDDDL